MTTTTETTSVVAQLLARGPEILSWADDVCTAGARSGTATARAIEGLTDVLRVAREHPAARAALREFVLPVLAQHTHVAGAYAVPLEQLKADAAALAGR